MGTNSLEQVTATLQEKYPDIGIRSIEVNESAGTSTFFIGLESYLESFRK